MAPQSKKTTTKTSSSKKKATAKKTPVKRRTRKKITKTSNFKKNILIVLSVFLMISLVIFGYFLGQNDTANHQATVSKINKSKDTYTTQQLLDDLSQIKTKKPEEKEKITSPKVVEIGKKRVVKSLPQVIVEEKKIEKIPVKIRSRKHEEKKEIALVHRSGKPKLAIIIDDVSSAKQLKNIISLPIKVTPSIFPPYEHSKLNHKLAQGLNHYMIHLPMQSGKSYDKQYGTLKITDSKEKMEARVKEIRRLFPTARYVNNHTGSAFTDSYKAMEMLYGILRQEGFIFVDSRTTASTKVPKIAYAFGDTYVARDIFIDNKLNVPYIHKQLRQAVKTAKKKGYAIAIGHPHSVTMKALSSAKDIFKDIELVYIDEIYRKRQ
jgi:polysaccharide deacetylase 2 family uncharacterized protein YibQ